MPDPFFDDLEQAYLAVLAHPDQTINVTRGDKKALVLMNHNDGNAIYIKILPVAQERAENSLRVDLTKRDEKEEVE